MTNIPSAMDAQSPTPTQQGEPKERLEIENSVTVWFEIDDLLQHRDRSQPTGVQRVCIELLTAAHQQYRQAIKFCRLNYRTGYFETVDFSNLLSEAPERSNGQLTKRIRHFVQRVPSFLRQLRGPIFRRYRQQSFERHIMRGDILVTLGAPPADRGYVENIAAAKQKFGLKYAVLIHDIIAATDSSYFPPNTARKFQHLLNNIIPCSDIIFTPSKYTCKELQRFATQQGWNLPPIEVIPFGGTFNAQHAAKTLQPLHLPEIFVLCVGTIEIRKNHRLLVQIWKRLAQMHGELAMPTLVFVGRMGWLIDDLMTELKKSRFLDGKVVLFNDLSDVQLTEAYRRCLFTVFPSLHEGWGLPIAESLAHGKLCIASNRASLPEVGGGFVDYFNPEDEEDALRKIEVALFDERYLARRTDHIRAEYAAPTWSHCARILLVKLAKLESSCAPAS